MRILLYRMLTQLSNHCGSTGTCRCYAAIWHRFTVILVITSWTWVDSTSIILTFTPSFDFNFRKTHAQSENVPINGVWVFWPKWCAHRCKWLQLSYLWVEIFRKYCRNSSPNGWTNTSKRRPILRNDDSDSCPNTSNIRFNSSCHSSIVSILLHRINKMLRLESTVNDIDAAHFFHFISQTSDSFQFLCAEQIRFVYAIGYFNIILQIVFALMRILK